MTATKDPISKPVKLSTQEKAEQTNSVVRNILEAEVTAREKKTEKLRALRLAQAETEAAKGPAPSAKAKKRGSSK